MAENLYSNYTNSEVLHTKSNFLLGKKFNLNISSSTLDINTAIARAESKERAFYQRFGKNNYDDFIEMVRMGFYYNAQDREVLENFTYSKLIQSIPQLAREQNHQIHKQEEYQLDIKIKLNPPKYVREILAPKATRRDGESIEKQINRTLQEITLDDGRLVRLLNLARAQVQKRSKEGPKSIGTGRKRSDAIATGNYGTKEIEVIQQLEELMQQDKSWLSIGIKKGDQDVALSTILIEDKIEKNFPWGYKPTEIKEMLKQPGNNERLYKAFLVVKNFVLKTLGRGASQELKRALEITWEQKIGPVLSTDFSFFERGSIYSESLKGALGEFQTAAIMELFNIRYGASTARTIAKITGDTDSTAGLADVVAFEQFGIQVKNYNETRNNKYIDTTSNPKLLTEYFSNQEVAKDVRIFLANYFFNKSFMQNSSETFEQIHSEISNLYYAIYSLSVSNDTKVSFYTISGKFFVPASEILKAIKNSAITTKPVEINSKTTIGRTDEGFEEGNLYSNYWERGSSDLRAYYKPTEQNYTSYNNLIGNAITIKSGFNYQMLIGDFTNSRYSLWK